MRTELLYEYAIVRVVPRPEREEFLNAGRDKLELDLVAGQSGLARRIDEAAVNGQPVWRLRLGPVPASRVQELSARAADLGFGTAQIVRE